MDNQAKLAANTTSTGARPPREGQPLCQGVIFCGACGTRYHQAKDPAYACQSRADHTSTPLCRTVAASTVDSAVAWLLLDAVTPQLALAAADEVTQRHTRAHRAAELALDRARYDAERAERTFSLVEPDNRLVARTLEARWEQALADAQAALATARAARPPCQSAPRSRHWPPTCQGCGTTPPPAPATANACCAR